MTLDRRTRSDEDLRGIDIDEFFTSGFLEFPKTRKELAAEGIRHLGARSLTLKVRDSTWTVTAGSTLTAQRGAPEDVALVELDEGRFSDWVQQQVTFNALLTAGTVQLERGSKRDLAAWDAAWLALLEGWPVSTDGLQFEDRHGAPLDLHRAFTPEDSPLDIADFFREAGYLHLRGWLDDDVMAKIGDEIDVALPSYREGDGRSWWATVDGGARECVRLQYFVEHSPTTAALLAGEEWTAVRDALAGNDELVQAPLEGNCIEALRKPLGVVEGVSDVPWHRDCNFGRHAYQCAGVVAGISVDAGDNESGLLRVIAGSHRIGMPAYRANLDPYLPVIAVATDRGDITVHQSCTLHEATPPLTRERRVMYTGFGLPPRLQVRPDTARQEQLKELREHAHLLKSQPRSPIAARADSTP